MNVIVTRDYFGVTIWKAGTNLVYKPAFGSDWRGRKGPKVWLPEYQLAFMRRLYSSRKTKLYFPELYDDIMEGQRIEGDLKIVM